MLFLFVAGACRPATITTLIVTSGLVVNAHRDLNVARAARHRLPAVYMRRFLVDRGGFTSYGPDTIDLHRWAVGNVDRILKGEKAPTCHTSMHGRIGRSKRCSQACRQAMALSTSHRPAGSC